MDHQFSDMPDQCSTPTSPIAPYDVVPPALKTDSETAKAQLNIINEKATSLTNGALRQLLAAHADSNDRLHADTLYEAIASLNVFACTELLDALMGGRSRASVSSVLTLMNGHKHNQEYTSLQAQPGIPVPYGVPQDAVEQITKLHHALVDRWGLLEKSFEQGDKNHDGCLSVAEFCTALRQVCKVHLGDNELKKLFAEVDKNGSGRVSYREFQRQFGQGKYFLPEFAKRRSHRGAGATMLHWEGQPQASNASRPFETSDNHGVKRYHCKPCHMYYMAKCFTENSITSRTHLCSVCVEAIELNKTPGRHCRNTPIEQWPDAMPGQSPKTIGRRQCTIATTPWQLRGGDAGPKPPWPADEPGSHCARTSSSSYGSKLPLEL